MTGRSEKFEFVNQNGETLAGILEMPAGKTQAAVLFAHCFSCNKNVLATTRISRELRAKGFAVLRFDFTGLGSSEGDFANTNFSTNLADLRSAVNALREKGLPPRILVGHSLGGAAVLYLAGEIEEVNLVATIGAPSEPAHVTHLFKGEAMETIQETGQANVNLGGRPFTIKKQFLDDVTEKSLKSKLSKLDKPVLICHSPFDKVVGIDQARKIYEAAKHPKSFVSLDGADHLLSSKPDSEFVASVIATWAHRYLDFDDENSTESDENAPHGQVKVTERNQSLTQDIVVGHHRLIADEPTDVGGSDLGVTPYDLLLAALGTCTSMTLRMYANRKQLEVTGIEVTLEHSRIHSDDCAECEDQVKKVDQIRRLIKIDGELTEAQRKRMLEIADMCPVHRTLLNQKQIITEPA